MTVGTLSLLRAKVATSAQPHLLAKLAGLSIAALLPALFWVAVFALAANGLGITLAPMDLTMTGGAITLFLTAVCAPIMLRG